MAPRKRVGHLKGRAKPRVCSRTQAVNTSGFPALPDEIYLEIMSHMPSVPIPIITFSPLDPEIRRSKHATLLSLSKTSRSLRRFFLRYLWQRIEVREGMKIGDEYRASGGHPYLGCIDWRAETHKKYNVELARQLEITTFRNPQLAQHVNYLDVFVGRDSFTTILAELAYCLSLFSNLHTAYISMTCGSGSDKVVKGIFREYSYPQIRNLYIMHRSQSLIASCPEARRVGFVKGLGGEPSHLCIDSYLEAIFNNCPRLEILEDLPQLFCTVDDCQRIVNSFPNLRTITVTPLAKAGHHIDILNELKHLQTIILLWNPPPSGCLAWKLPLEQRAEYLDVTKKDWIATLKRVLRQVGLRDSLEKTLVIKEVFSDTKVLIKPNEAYN